MAALNQSPSGFSYAQAARGQTSIANSQAPSSKVTSGTASPATGTLSELGLNGNWADDVEATTGERKLDAKNTSQEPSRSPVVKDSVVERTKSESRTQNGSSAVSSPELAATPSTATHTDESSSAANGTSSSDTTWETKSQNSEPAWIAERKERQTSGHNEEQPKGKRGKKEPKEANEPALPQPVPNAIVLQDAPPPPANPWAKRMEVSKTKTVPITPVPKSTAPHQGGHIENQRPQADSRRKANSVASVNMESRVAGDAKKSTGFQGKRASNVRNEDHGSKPTEDTAAAQGNAVQREYRSLPNLSSIPPPVRDEVSWPTPDSAQDKERGESTGEK